MLLSIIIPVYNADSWLKPCLDSILTSVGSSPDGVEILLIDDGSTDRSSLICDQYAEKYSQVRTCHQSNGGVASARNTGLKYAKGEYFAWVDPDDLVSPEWFPAILAAAAQGAPDVIVMDSLLFGQCPDREERYGRTPGWVDPDLFRQDVISDIRIRSGLPNKIIRREFYRNVRFNTGYVLLEDYAVMPEILQDIQSVYYIPECLYLYRQHSGSLVHQITREKAYQSVEIALERGKQVSQELQAAANIAAAQQAFVFCRNSYILEDVQLSPDKLRYCRSILRSFMPDIFRCRDLSCKMKLKMALMGFNGYGLVMSSGKKQNRGKI